MSRLWRATCSFKDNNGGTLMDFLPMLIGCLLVFVVGMLLFVMANRAENSDSRKPRSKP